MLLIEIFTAFSYALAYRHGLGSWDSRGLFHPIEEVLDQVTTEWNILHPKPRSVVLDPVFEFGL